MARTTLLGKWLENRHIGFQQAVLFDIYSRTVRIWLIPIISWICLFSIYRSIYPMVIHTRLEPVDVINVLANSPPINFGNNNDTRLPLNAITAIMEDIYMRNENEYQSKIQYSSIIVQPVLTLEEDLSLHLMEGFYNFQAGAYEFPKIKVETKIIEKLDRKDDSTALVTYTNDLLKIVSLPRYSSANASMFKNRKLCKVASIGLAVASATTMICYFSIQIFSNLILHYTMLAILSICSIVGISFSIFNFVMVVTLFDHNYRHKFDLLIVIMATITNLYLIISLVLSLISLLLIIEGDLENQIEDFQNTETANVDETSEFRFTPAPFNLFCRKQSGQEPRTIPLLQPTKSQRARPESATSNAVKSPESTGRARSATAPSGLQGLNLFGSANSDDDTILLSSAKQPISNTSRFAESV